MTDIKINAPGAGQWVMDRAGGVFMPGHDNVFSRHREDGAIRGGFVLAHYLGASMTVHCAGDDKHWCNRDLLWLIFHYAFVQLGCIKMLCVPRSDDHRKLTMWLRAGWQLETVVKDVFAPGVHMMVLFMTKDTCPWLNYQPREWCAGKAA